MESLLHDISWIEPLRSPLLTPLFQGFTALGYGNVLMLLLPLGYWLWNKPLFLRLTLLVLATGLINGLLKDLLQDPRPQGFQLDAAIGESWGMPSGHAQVAIVMWGWLAIELRRRWCWWLSATLISGIVFSRLYLGVHDIEDLLAGLAIGAVTLTVFACIRHWSYWRAQYIPGHLILIAVVALISWYGWPAGGDNQALKLGAITAGALLGYWRESKLHFSVSAFQPAPIQPGWLFLQAAAGLSGLIALQVLLHFTLGRISITEFSTEFNSVSGGLLTGYYITRWAPLMLRKFNWVKEPLAAN